MIEDDYKVQMDELLESKRWTQEAVAKLRVALAKPGDGGFTGEPSAEEETLRLPGGDAYGRETV